VRVPREDETETAISSNVTGLDERGILRRQRASGVARGRAGGGKCPRAPRVGAPK